MPRINRGGRRWTARSGTPGAAGETVRILGIDPGSQATGFGIVDWRDGDASYVASGAIRTRGAAFAPRLRQIFDGVLELVREYRPAEVAIERVFMHRNADSALKLGQARGAALAAVPVGTATFEYAPRAVKLAVVGFGAAEKGQVGHMIGRLLALDARVPVDAADALAVALCHAQARRLALLMRVSGRRA